MSTLSMASTPTEKAEETWYFIEKDINRTYNRQNISRVVNYTAKNEQPVQTAVKNSIEQCFVANIVQC